MLKEKVNKKLKEERFSVYPYSLVVSDNFYNMVIGFNILWGIILMAYITVSFHSAIAALPVILIIVLYFAGSIGSMIIIQRNDSLLISFLAYNGLIVSMSLIIAPYIMQFKLLSVINVLLATLIIMVVMMILSTVYPKLFLGLGKTLFTVLLLSVFAQIILIVMGISTTFLSYVLVVIFSLYVVYDWAKAQEYPKTLNNAVDSAADIFIDIVNLFIQLLGIFGDAD